jgi:hypothetical protein
MAPLPPPAGIFDARAFIGWGLTIFSCSLGALYAFAVAKRAQKPGEAMSAWSWTFLVLAFVLAGTSFVLFAVALDLPGFVAATYGALTAYQKGFLEGAGASIPIVFVAAFGRRLYVRLKDGRALARLPVVMLDPEGDVWRLVVRNNGRKAVFSAKLRVIGDDSVSATLDAIWEPTESTEVSIPKGKNRRLRLARFSPGLMQPYPSLNLPRIGHWSVFGVSDGKSDATETRLSLQTVMVPLPLPLSKPQGVAVTLFIKPEPRGGPFVYDIDLRSSTPLASRRAPKRLHPL